MGYLFLLIALLAGATKGYCGKKTSNYTKDFRDAIFANFVRMVLCAIIGFMLVFFTEGAQELIPNKEMLLISALSGVATSVFVVTWLISVKKSAYMMLDIFLMLGILIPLISSSIFFGEDIKITQWLGIIVLFIAVVIMCSYNNSIKTKITPLSLLLLLICGISNGIADFSQKLFTKHVPDGSTATFNLYTYIFAAIVLIITLMLSPKRAHSEEKTNIKKFIGYIAVMAVFLFVNSYFKTLAAKHLSAVLLYPLNQGCGLILSNQQSTNRECKFHKLLAKDFRSHNQTFPVALL